MHPKDISILDFTYTLPAEKIAFHPLEQRDQSKLLVYNNGVIQTNIYKQIGSYLPAGSLLIFNNTRVVEARILFRKPTGATIEIFCLEPAKGYPDIVTAMQEKGEVRWQCLIGGASKWKPGQLLEKRGGKGDTAFQLTASYEGKEGDSFLIHFQWSPSHLSFAEILHEAGVMPLPPYIKREATNEDAGRYQTVYGVQEGSVAAPTAGLHFTPELIERIQQKNIETGFVTLHVGAGTFKPVKAPTMATHPMHAEFIDVNVATINTLLNYSGKDITAVGTTSMRTLESLYWMGIKTIIDPGVTKEELALEQWDAYELPAEGIDSRKALSALLQWMRNNKLERLILTTQLLIAPGYTFRIVNRLVTNFHQPQSTLLLLVAAFVGEDWKKIYSYALENDFRFLSYGDGCLLQLHSQSI